MMLWQCSRSLGRFRLCSSYTELVAAYAKIAMEMAKSIALGKGKLHIKIKGEGDK